MTQKLLCGSSRGSGNGKGSESWLVERKRSRVGVCPADRALQQYLGSSDLRQRRTQSRLGLYSGRPTQRAEGVLHGWQGLT